MTSPGHTEPARRLGDPSPLRVLAPLGAGALASTLLLLAMLRFLRAGQGISGLLADALNQSLVRTFAVSLLLREILPLYILAAYALALAAVAWGRLPFCLASWRDWRGRDLLLLTLAGLLWLHLCLWWRVPPALWVLPGLDRLPFGVLFPLLALLVLWPLHRITARRGLPGWRRAVTLAGWLLAWTALASLPALLARPRPPRPQGPPARVLLLGVDALRADVAYEQGLGDFTGTHHPHAITPIPATRLCWSLLWGGSPTAYTAGHLLPSEEEFLGREPYALLDLMRDKGLKARFFIDDGGTMALGGRSPDFDRVLMPSAGWEGFADSNLAVHFPLYASWLDVLRVFPPTHPWTPLDAGLRRALEEGRGADVVMYHTCLIHQPLFLHRDELASLGRWWALSPRDLRPPAGSQGLLGAPPQDPRCDPERAYALRVRSLLAAWRGIWEGLEADPQYRGALRVLFADHGEAFYRVEGGPVLQGVHGYDLNPWELRVPFLVAGPGWGKGWAPPQAMSLLDLRDALAAWAQDGGAGLPRPEPGREGFAAAAYHTLRLPHEGGSGRFRVYDAANIVRECRILPGGLWMMRYTLPAAQRRQDQSVALARGSRLEIYRPLKAGGALCLSFDGYRYQGEREVSEEAFRPILETAQGRLGRPWVPGERRPR